MRAMKKYLRLLSFIRPHKGIFALAVVFVLLSSLFDCISLAMFVPLADRVLNNTQIVFNGDLPDFLIDLIAKLNSISQLAMLKLMVIFGSILLFSKNIVLYVQQILMSAVSLRVVRDVRNLIYRKLHKLSLDFYSRMRAGELVSRISNDTGQIQNAVFEGVTDLVYQSFKVIILSIAVFKIHWKLAMVSVALLPLIAIPIIQVGKTLRKITLRTQEKQADLISSLFEAISGVRVVKAFSMEDYEINKFAGYNQGFYKLMMKQVKRINAIGPVTELVGMVGAFIVFYYGGLEVIRGVLSGGIFILFLAALLSLIKPCRRLSRVHAINQQALAAADRIFTVLDEEPSVADKSSTELKPITKNITYENVSFKYEEADVLQDISFEITSGEVVAFVGSSGTGKTTLVNLLPRFYDPNAGTIKIDGVDIKEGSLKSLRSQIGIVTQETILFNDTLRANIAYGHEKEAKEEDIIKAARIAHAHEFISKLPEGYDTIIGDRGVKLSGGERQRIAIARAILKNPPILILDEATSQLDTESERLVQDAINHLMEGRTVLAIAHRLSTIQHAHKIIVLDKGKIVENDTHQQLISNPQSLYSHLYNLQFKA